MIRGLYAATTALDAAMQRQEVIAQNLAHSTQTGYRERGVSFETFDRFLQRDVPPTGDLTGTRIVGVYNNFQSGAFQQTGAPFDFAIESDAFFVFDGPNGPLFSRNGAFRLTANGQIVSQSGYTVRGTAGPIIIPPNSENITISREGNLFADGVQIGQFQLARFNDLKQLTSVGPTLFRAGNQAGTQFVTGNVSQGFRESSNVNSAQAMVEMIAGSRYFEAAQRALRTLAESIQLNTRPQT